MVTQPFADTHGKATVQRLRGAHGIRDTAEIGERRQYSRAKYVAWVSHRRTVVGQANTGRNVRGPRSAVKGGAHAFIGIDETGEVHALGHRKVQVSGIIAVELLFVADVRGVDTWILVVLTKHSHADTGWRRSAGWGRILNGCRIGPVSRGGIESGACRERLLLNAVGSDGAHLSEHVLPGVEDPPACAKSRLAVAKDVPGETEARLKLLVLIRDKAGRWKLWIGQIRLIGSARWRDSWIGELLGVPAEAVIQSEI